MSETVSMRVREFYDYYAADGWDAEDFLKVLEEKGLPSRMGQALAGEQYWKALSALYWAEVRREDSQWRQPYGHWDYGEW